MKHFKLENRGGQTILVNPNNRANRRTAKYASKLDAEFPRISRLEIRRIAHKIANCKITLDQARQRLAERTSSYMPAE